MCISSIFKKSIKKINKKSKYIQLFKDFLFFTLLLIGYSINGSAQQDALYNYAIKDGLPSENIYLSFQDEKGFLWLPTGNGPCRFNGAEFKTYPSDVLKDKVVINFFSGEDNRIWFNNLSKDLFYLEGDSVIRYRPAFLPENVSINDIVTVNNEIWLGTELNGLFRINNDLKNPKLINHYLSNQLYGKLSRLGENDILFQSKFGDKFFFNTNKNKIDTLHLERTDNKNNYRANVLSVKLEGIAIGTLRDSTGFLLRTPIIIKNNISYSPFNSYRPVRNLIKLEDSTYVFSNINGVYNFDSEYQFIKKLAKGYPKLYPLSVIEDRDKNLWYTSESHGLFRGFNYTAINFNSLNSDLPNESFTNIIEGPDGYIIASTVGGWILLFKGKELKRKYNIFEETEPNDELGKEYFYSMELTTSGDILACFPKMVTIKNITSEKPKFELIASSKYNKSNGVYCKCLTQDRSGRYWRGHYTGMNRFKKDVGLSKRIHANRTYNIFQSKNDSIWLGSTKGLFQVEGDTAFLFSQNGITLDFSIQDIAEDGNFSLWTATSEGVFCIQKDTILHFTEKDGLSSNFCNDLYIDSQNHVWVATIKGVTKLGYPDYRPHIIDEYDGLIYNEVTSLYKDEKNNNIWAGTAKGLSIIEDITDRIQEPPIIYITEVKVNDKSLPLQSKYNLAYGQNRIHFEFKSVYFTGKIRYRYRLRNSQQEWVETNEGQIVFPFLSDGDYVFEVKALDKNGQESKELAVVAFTIRPHWMRTKSFFGLTVSLLLLGLGLIFYLREQYIKHKGIEKTATNKKIAELELQTLRAQMNPHFIFNALNAIQVFIFDQKENLARNYLVKFSRLIRLFLESTRASYIALDEEINLLELYVELEQLRFSGKFDFHIEIDEAINPEFIDIPTMLLQPFLENAINHGLVYKREKGNLWLKFQKVDRFLIIRVKDDGIGRTEAALHKKNASKSYKSRGLEILQDRIETLRRMGNYLIELEIVDLKNAEQEAAGTEIIIKLDLEDED